MGPTWRWLHAATRRTSLRWSALKRRSPAPMARTWCAMPARTAASTTVQPYAATTTKQHPEDPEAGTDGTKDADADAGTDKKEKTTESADKAPCTAEDQKAGLNCVVGMDSGAT